MFNAGEKDVKCYQGTAISASTSRSPSTWPMWLVLNADIPWSNDVELIERGAMHYSIEPTLPGPGEKSAARNQHPVDRHQESSMWLFYVHLLISTHKARVMTKYHPNRAQILDSMMLWYVMYLVEAISIGSWKIPFGSEIGFALVMRVFAFVLRVFALVLHPSFCSFFPWENSRSFRDRT